MRSSTINMNVSAPKILGRPWRFVIKMSTLGPTSRANMCTVSEADINHAGYPSAKHLSLEMHIPMGEAVVSGEAAALA
jgi:hypothetical protein